MALSLPSRFEEELNRAENEPSVILEISDGFISDTQTTAADWAANNGETAVDYANPDFIGSVVLESDTIPDITQNSTTAQRGLWSGGLSSPGTYVEVYQTFQQVSGADVYLDTVSLWLLNGTTGRTATFYVKIRNAAGSDLTSEVSNALAAGASGQYDFDFSAFNLLLDDSTTYQIYVRVVMSAWEFIGVADIYIDDTNVYANGALYTSAGVPVDSGNADLRMNISFFGYYYTTPGSIETKTFDLGEVPTNNGTFIVYDNKNGQTLTYILETSETGAWAGEEVSLGAYVDGDAITTLNQYYRVLGSFSTTDLGVTPELQEISIRFDTFSYFATDTAHGYEPSIDRVSSLSTKISDFNDTTIGQLSITLSRTPAAETYFLSGSVYPRNKPAYLKFGFVPRLGQTYSPADYLTFYSGVVDNYGVNSNNTITVSIRDITNKFDLKLPLTSDIDSNPLTSPLVYTASHPITVMLDILQNELVIRDSFINSAAFTTVSAALPGWVVTRTITNDQESARDLLEELRKLMSCYLIPQSDGKISIKQWNAAETAADTWTDDDFMNIKWDRNSKELKNQVVIYYDWDTLGDEYTNYDEVYVDSDATSISNYDETKEEIIPDKWTLAAQSAQITARTAIVKARYKNPPAIIDCTMGLKKLKYEVGDIVAVTTARAIGSATGGITNENFQIINKNLDFQDGKLTFKLLQVAG